MRSTCAPRTLPEKVLFITPNGTMDEPWVFAGTFPGFLAGIFFSVVLGIAARRRRLDELSVAKVAGWGALELTEAGADMAEVGVAEFETEEVPGRRR